MSLSTDQYPIPEAANSYIAQHIGALHQRMAREGKVSTADARLYHGRGVCRSHRLHTDTCHVMDYIPHQQDPIGVHTLSIVSGKVEYRFDNEKYEGERRLVDFSSHAAQVKTIKKVTDMYLTEDGRVKGPKDDSVNPRAIHRANVQPAGELKIRILYRVTKPESEDWSLSYEIRYAGPSHASYSAASVGQSVSLEPSASFTLASTTSAPVPAPTHISLVSGVTAGPAASTTAPVGARGPSESPPPELNPTGLGNHLLFPGLSDSKYSLDDW